MSDCNPEPRPNVVATALPEPERSLGRWWGSPQVRLAAAGLIAGGLALGGYGIASAASSHDPAPQSARQALAANAGSSSFRSSKPAADRPRRGGPVPLGPLGLGVGFGLGGSFARGGTVTQVTPTTITVDTFFGSTLTAGTDSSTVYNEGGKTVARSAVTVGEQVVFRPLGRARTSSSSSSQPVAFVEIVEPQVFGKVVSVNGPQLVVAQQDGLNVTVNTSTSTTYDEVGKSASASDVRAGTVVSVTGSLSADHDQIDAATIEVVLPSVAGRVTGVSGTTITITIFGGTAETVTTDSSTAFHGPGGTTTVASVAKGNLVLAFGTPATGNTFAAVTVTSARPSRHRRAPLAVRAPSAVRPVSAVLLVSAAFPAQVQAGTASDIGSARSPATVRRCKRRLGAVPSVTSRRTGARALASYEAVVTIASGAWGVGQGPGLHVQGSPSRVALVLVPVHSPTAAEAEQAMSPQEVSHHGDVDHERGDLEVLILSRANRSRGAAQGRPG